MATQVPWTRIVAEGVAIIVSILLAFGIQAWWEASQDSRLELEYAERLRADLARDTLRMQQGVGQIEAKMTLLRDLISADPIPRLMADPVTTMRQFRWSTYQGMNELTTGTIRELEGSGRLVLLRNSTLRDQLASYYALYEVVLRALPEAYGPYREIASSSIPGEVWDAFMRDSNSVNPALLEAGLQSLLARPDLVGAVNSELIYDNERLRWHRVIGGRAAELLQVIDSAYPS